MGTFGSVKAHKLQMPGYNDYFSSLSCMNSALAE